MKCLFCSYVREELISRTKQVIEIYGENPSLYFIITEVLANCYCDKTGWKLYGGRCDESEMISEEDYIEFLIENGFEEQIDEFEEEKFPIDDLINDPINDPINKETKIQRKRNRDRRYKAKAKRKYQDLKNSFPSPFYPVGKDGGYESDENKIVRYKRDYNPPRAKWLRKVSNKKVRKEKEIPSKGSGFKKLFDYWWNLW